MKKSLRALFVIISVFLVSAAMAQQKKVIYTCPMHPEVQMEKPGSCPKCGMTLEKKTITIKQGKSQPDKKEPMDMVADTTKPKMEMADTTMNDGNMEGMEKIG